MNKWRNGLIRDYPLQHYEAITSFLNIACHVIFAFITFILIDFLYTFAYNKFLKRDIDKCVNNKDFKHASIKLNLITLKIIIDINFRKLFTIYSIYYKIYLKC